VVLGAAVEVVVVEGAAVEEVISALGVVDDDGSGCWGMGEVAGAEGPLYPTTVNIYSLLPPTVGLTTVTGRISEEEVCSWEYKGTEETLPIPWEFVDDLPGPAAAGLLNPPPGTGDTTSVGLNITILVNFGTISA